MDKLYYKHMDNKNRNYNSPVKKIKIKRNMKNFSANKHTQYYKFRENANSLFEKMRNLNEEEIKEYRNILNNDFNKTGVNFFDVL